MYKLIDVVVKVLKSFIPESVVRPLRPTYHWFLAWLFALWYGMPARGMVVIGVTGTKGKSTVCEMLYTALVKSGHPTVLASTIRFVTPTSEERNLFKMTMQGRGHLQHLLARARREGTTHAVVEITSEGLRQNRHRFLFLNALIVTNIHPEHIESHGSFENYVAAKRAIVRELERSEKRPRILIVNTDSKETTAFLEAAAEMKVGYGMGDLASAPSVPLPGDFNRLNAFATLKALTALGEDEGVVRKALGAMSLVRGRTEEVDAGQPFKVIVDYAHTPDSLKAVYGAFPGRKICVLGNTGGGRDRWKRSEMARIAESTCVEVILTNEDPYDEDPRAIVDEMARAMLEKPVIELDRRGAIRYALSRAQPGDTVLITGKGTDPYIMGPKGTQVPWDDATVTREELHKLLGTRSE